MTNTPSPTDENRELIAKLRYGEGVTSWWELGAQAADRLESLLSDRAKLEEAADHLLHRVPIEPGMNREPFDRLRAALNRNTDRAT